MLSGREVSLSSFLFLLLFVVFFVRTEETVDILDVVKGVVEIELQVGAFAQCLFHHLGTNSYLTVFVCFLIFSRMP